ncbi:MAG: flagellar FliJ family protein [Oscillospiraceae bacterium]|nr:flagellar FliJ family protein [Oscillospiraceae bacterium]
MKRFEFSLNKLKSYKNQVLDREKDALAFLRQQQQLLEEERSESIRRLTESNEEYKRQSMQGLNVVQIQVFKGFHKSLSDRITELEEAIKRAEFKVQQQVRVVVEATKEVKTLEKLEEKQLEEYKFKAAKAEEKFIDEFVLNQTYKAG